jgi:transposase-like protein
MKRFSDEFKASIIQKSLSPGGPSMIELARKHDLPASTLYNWRAKYANHASMSKLTKWTPKKKLEAIIQTGGLWIRKE